MSEHKTFQNLQVLQAAKVTAKEQLLERYDDVVEHYINIIEMVAKANNENHFEAMRRIQTKTDMADDPAKRIVFAAALMEIVEEKNLEF